MKLLFERPARGGYRPVGRRRSERAARSVWVLVAGIALATGCVGTPRSTAELGFADEPVRFEGLARQPLPEVVIEAWDYSQDRFAAIGQVRPELGDAMRAPTGRVGYRFATSARVPAEARFWSRGKRTAPLSARVRLTQGGVPLSTFDADAETCVRVARVTGDDLTSALQRCRSSASPAIELSVGQCGGLGQSCCVSHEETTTACSPELACESARCRRPSYPVPVVPDVQEDIAVALGHRFYDLYLEIDDRASGPDTQLPLITASVAEPFVEVLEPHPNTLRVRFQLPLFRPGPNRFRLRGTTLRGALSSSFVTPYREALFELPEEFGLGKDGSLALPPSHYPRTLSECGRYPCKDADGDGLSDLWENVVLHQLRPRLMFDHKDAFFGRGNGGDGVRQLGSVLPWRKDGIDYVSVSHVVLFSRDYGAPIVSAFSHPGDSEGHAMLLAVLPSGELRWERSIAKGHACLTCGPRWRWGGQDFGDDGVPLVFVEKNKHGLWAEASACRSGSPFGCNGLRSLRPDIVNVGDWTPDGPRALVDALGDARGAGPYSDLAARFPGEAIWSKDRARLKGRFCGGHAIGCTQRRSANLPGQVIRQLVKRVERDGYERAL